MSTTRFFRLFGYLLIVLFVEAFLSGCDTRVLLNESGNSILSIHSLREIDWCSIQKDSLVIFDLDETLVIPADAILQPRPSNRAIRKSLQNRPAKIFLAMARPYNLQEGDVYLKTALLRIRQSKEVLVEPCVLAIIEFLNLRSIKTIALTASATGSYGSFPSFETIRVERLRNILIDFSKSFPNIPSYRLKGFPTYNQYIRLKNGGTPVFRDGVLFTNDHSKGAALKAFLRRASWVPKTIVFIDDCPIFLRQVRKQCQSMHIPFKGFLYHGAQGRFKKPDSKIARVQLDYLETHGIWLDDESAKRLFIQARPPYYAPSSSHVIPSATHPFHPSSLQCFLLPG